MTLILFSVNLINDKVSVSGKERTQRTI